MLLVDTYQVEKQAQWLKALPLALILTLVLFLLMERLIAMSEYPSEETANVVFPELTWEEPPVIETRQAEIKKVEAPAEPPELPSPATNQQYHTDFSIPQIAVKTRGNTGLNQSFSAGFPVPKILSAAVYPRRALQQGIEGYVDLRFDVSAIGKTENIQVLNAKPSGVFEKAAIKAAQKWRFQPVMKNGQGQPFIGMSRRVKFEMEN